MVTFRHLMKNKHRDRTKQKKFRPGEGVIKNSPRNYKRRYSMKKNHVVFVIAMALIAFGATHSTAKMEEKTIVETAIAAGSFNTLVTAVKAAGLVDTLSSEGPFTVFAPTDDAFAKLPEGTIEALLKDKEKLTAILTYHVVADKVMAKDVMNLTSADTVNGQSLTIKVENGTVMVDGAKVVKTDIVCSNGVIHVIDAVILPK
jgi:uncharacterized surface protein with fasciclin (FAS1) repeats